jgi:hypothetical protein
LHSILCQVLKECKSEQVNSVSGSLRFINTYEEHLE